MTRRTHTRRGVTLVELLVAAAMSIMVMWLLTWCYQQGLASFSNTKTQGDLMDQERMVTGIMTRDLIANHFLSDDTKQNLGLRVSDLGTVGATGYVPPTSGYFMANSTAGTSEGADGDGFGSWRATNHLLQFTIILPGGPPQSLFGADVPFGNTSPIYGRAAEVAYFLVPTGIAPNGTQLFNLIRRQRLCALTGDDQGSYNTKLSSLMVPPADAAEVMATTPLTGTVPPTIFTLSDLKTATNRLTPAPISAFRIGEDILMSNVTSLEIKFTGTMSSTTGPVPFAAPFPGNSDFPYDNLPGGTFDTAVTTGTNPIRVTGVMIRLRAYSPRNQITRQTTFIVSL